MISRFQAQLGRASAWAALPASSNLGCIYRLPGRCRGHSSTAAAAPRASGSVRAPRPSLLVKAADTDVSEPQPADDEEPMGGYTPSDYITFSDDERWQCNHDAEVVVDAPADVCFGLWHDWSKLVDFLDLIGQIGLDNDSPNMAMFQCFYRFRRLPLMELVFIVERTQVVQHKSISFKSVYGMPLTGEVKFIEQEDGSTLVQLHLSHPTPKLLLQLGIGPFGIETSLLPVFKDNMATFKALAEGLAPPDWQSSKAAVGQRAVREEAEEADRLRRQRPPPPQPQPRATLSAEEAILLVQESFKADEAAAAAAAGGDAADEAAAAGAQAAAIAAEGQPDDAAAAGQAAAEQAAGQAAPEQAAPEQAAGQQAVGRRPRTSRKSASAAPTAAGNGADDATAAAAAAAGGKRGRSRASTSRKTSTSAAAAEDESSSSSPARRRSRSATASANGTGQTDNGSSSGGGSSSRGRRSTRRTASAGKE